MSQFKLILYKQVSSPHCHLWVQGLHFLHFGHGTKSKAGEISISLWLHIPSDLLGKYFCFYTSISIASAHLAPTIFIRRLELLKLLCPKTLLSRVSVSISPPRVAWANGWLPVKLESPGLLPQGGTNSAK